MRRTIGSRTLTRHEIARIALTCLFCGGLLGMVAMGAVYAATPVFATGQITATPPAIRVCYVTACQRTDDGSVHCDEPQRRDCP